MVPMELLLAGAVLLATLAIGTIVHELSHAITLQLLGVSCEIEWGSSEEGTGFARAWGALATVTPRSMPPDLPPWRLRLAALMPLALAIPIPLVLVGVLPDPLATGDPVVASATVGWLACGLPSPQDFSLVWHAEEAIGRFAT